MTRGQQDWSHKFLSVQHAIEELDCDNAIFDGEVVVLDEHNKSNFQYLQNALSEQGLAKKFGNKFIYYIFDLLFLNGRDLRNLPLIERKEILKTIIPKRKNTILQYSDHIIGKGQDVFTHACKLHLEGIICKEANSLYEEKRTRSWLKVKCIKGQEFVIGGYTEPQGSRNHFGSLLIGVFSDKEFIYCGHVGTGFNEASLKSIWKLLQQNRTNEMPFNKKPKLKRRAHWVKPKIVIEVDFTEWTQDGVLRHPSFKGIRLDKSANKVIKEMPSSKTRNMKTSSADKVKRVRDERIKEKYSLTHPDKDMYPPEGITKQDIAEFYDNVCDLMLPYVNNRPLTLVRCPNGYKKCFYQKHLEASAPKAIHSIPIKEKTKREKYSYINSKEGLIGLVQMGVLEIHLWGSKINKVEQPDMLIFDLDPAENVEWKDVVKAAFIVRDNLAKIKLKSFVKTTGGKGLHVVVPIQPKAEWPEVKEFCHAFVNAVVDLYPDKFLSNMNKAKRKGKIFLDYLRNARGATAVAPYSTRSREHATVSTPLSWKELSPKVKGSDFTIRTVPKRLAKLKTDPWKDFFKIKQKLPR